MYIIGGIAAVAGGAAVAFFVFRKKQDDFVAEGGEKQSKQLYKTQIKSKNSHKREAKETLVCEAFSPAEQNV
jgi:hypothetical protein